MKPIEELLKQINKPILLLGKGPSFEIRDKFLLPKFFTVTLNHAARAQESDLCSLIDIDVFDDCGEEIYKKSKNYWKHNNSDISKIKFTFKRNRKNLKN